MRGFQWCALLSSVLVLTGFLLGPEYHRPKIDAPAAYRGEDSASASSIADLPWWSVFRDPTLQDLIQTALANNRDLRAAAARVEQSRQLAAQSHAQYLPQIGYEAGISAVTAT
jgi:multidrug efflux system outer membrane protein